jgi:DNA invertase Pin-like site-specific DNA recombinase
MAVGDLQEGEAARRHGEVEADRDLLTILVAIKGKGASFRSLGEAWADTTTPHGRLMLAPASSSQLKDRAVSFAAATPRRVTVFT